MVVGDGWNGWRWMEKQRHEIGEWPDRDEEESQQQFYKYMKLVSSLQKDYQQLWKHIIRPPRTPYAQSRLGPALFECQGMPIQRKDFCLTNSRGLEFTCSLWLPTKPARSHCVVYLHGNSSNRLEGMEYLLKLLNEGLALCTFDFSGCGNAEGEYISLGLHEQQDLQLVIEHLAVYPRIDRIAVWGRSMGAVTALMFLPGSRAVSAAVFDSPFKSFRGLVEDMSSRTTKVPGIVLSAALRLIDRTIQEKAKFSLYNLDPIKRGAPLIQIPAFFIVGIEDEVIPIEHTSDLFEVYAGDDKIIKMVNGGHNDSRPDLIIKLVIQFLKSRLEDSPISPQNEVSSHKQDNVTKVESKLAKEESKYKQEQVPEEGLKGAEDGLKGSEDLSLREVQKLEQAVKKGEFSWSNLFSGFSRSKKDQKETKKQDSGKQAKELKIEEKQSNQVRKQGKQQLEKAAERAKQDEAESKEAARKRKKKEKDQIQKAEFEATLQEKVREYSYCYL